jgi:uncharacterized protein YacL
MADFTPTDLTDTVSSNPLEFITQYTQIPYTNLSNVSLCLVGAMLIGGGILTSMKCHECEPHSTFRASLTKDQLLVYEKIVKERQSLYLQGLVIGLIIATTTLFLTGNSLNPITSSCVYAGITLTVQYFYYTLGKKSPLMVNYLQTDEQVMLWNQVYTKMQRKYHVGMLMGLIGYAFLPTMIRTARTFLPF